MSADLSATTAWVTGRSTTPPDRTGLPLDDPRAPLLAVAAEMQDLDLARLVLVGSESVPVGDGRWLVPAARRAVATGLEVAALSAHVLSADLANVRGHEERAVARRELELASRVLDPPSESPAPEQAELSVVVPAHDVGPWIGQTLESLTEQDVALDVVVVVDHCTDETLSVVRRAEGAGAVRTVQTRLRGGAHARNVGAALATAPRLVFCDGDDLVPRGAYRSLVDASVRSDAPLTLGSFLKFRPAHTWSPARRHEAYRQSATHDGIEQAPTLVYHRACWNKVFVTSWWREEDIVFPEVARSNDIVPMTRAYLAADTISVVEDFVYLYRERPGSSSMSSRVGTEASLLSYLEQEVECAGILAAHAGPALWREYAHTVLQEDAWIQVGRYLRRCGAEARPPRADVLERCRELVRQFDADVYARMPLSARLTFAAVAAGRDDLANCGALTDDREPATVRAAGWAGVLELGLARDPLCPPEEHVWRFGILPTLDDLLDDDSLTVEETGRALRRLRTALEASDAWPTWRGEIDDVVRRALDHSPDAALLAAELSLLRGSEARLERVERLAAGRLRLHGTHSERGVVTSLHLLHPRGSGLVEAISSDGYWTAEVAAPTPTWGDHRLAVTVQEPDGRRVLSHLRHLLEPLPVGAPTDRLRVRIDPGPANLVLEHRHHLARRAWQLARRRVAALRRP